MIHRKDNTFEIEYNGLPYHLTEESEPNQGLYQETLQAYINNPELFEEYKEEVQDSKLIRTTELTAMLADIDLQSVRPMRAILDGTATDEDKQKLADLEAQAEALRAKLAELENA